MTQDNSHSLLDADDSGLVAIDIQDAFLDKLPKDERERLLNSMCWLMSLARWRQIPILITAEEVDKQPLSSKFLDSLPGNTPIFDKGLFGLAHQPDILAAVQKPKRKTAVLIGLETDVCVTHSAIGLLENGFRVAVVADATGTPAPGQTYGLDRMRNAGVTIVNMKGIFYEWLRTVDAVNRFHEERPEMRGLSGITL